MQMIFCNNGKLSMTNRNNKNDIISQTVRQWRRFNKPFLYRPKSQPLSYLSTVQSVQYSHSPHFSSFARSRPRSFLGIPTNVEEINSILKHSKNYKSTSFDYFYTHLLTNIVFVMEFSPRSLNNNFCKHLSQYLTVPHPPVGS